MKSKSSIFVLLVFFFPAMASATLDTQIWYDAHEITPAIDDSPAKWQYTYDMLNIGLDEPIQQFTIWFDYGKYNNLVVETPSPLSENWDETVWQPEPLLQDDGAYDARALGERIKQGEKVSGFIVTFDWLADGEPGKQWYEIVDPETFETIDSGWTIPEPTTLVLLGIGAIALLKKRKS